MAERTLTSIFNGHEISPLYGTDWVDSAFLTHPDGDHIGGLGDVVRELRVGVLALQRRLLHGGGTLRASAAVEDLASVADEEGTTSWRSSRGPARSAGCFAGPSVD